MTIPIMPKERGFGESLGGFLGKLVGQEYQKKREERGIEKQAEKFKTLTSSEEFKNLPIAQQAGLTNILFGKDTAQPFVQEMRASQQEARSSQPPIDPEKLSGLLQKFGMSPEEAARDAELYGSLSTGGKTSYAKMLIDKVQRGAFSPDQPQRPEVSPETQPENITSGEVEEFDFPKVNPFLGLTPKEAVKKHTDLRKENIDFYKTSKEKGRGLKVEERSLKQLERLNNTGKLPKGLGRLNISPKTGELVFPAAATPESQLFVKIINDFTTKAKDSFGARVTNFEIDRFMKRLPSLANTASGREMVLNQMQVINNLDQLNYDSLKEVYNKYGLGNINAEDAEQIAESIRTPKEEKLLEEYDNLIFKQDFISEEPTDKILIEYKGKKIRVPSKDLDKALSAGAKRL